MEDTRKTSFNLNEELMEEFKVKTIRDKITMKEALEILISKYIEGKIKLCEK